MEAKELFHQDGKTASIFYCGKCRIVARTFEVAENCCLPTLCQCGTEVEKYYTTCAKCRSINEAIISAERLDKAVAVEDEESCIYSEDFQGYHDGYFSDMSAFLDYLSEQEEEGDFEWPRWVYATTPHTIPTPDANDLIEQWCEDGYEDMSDHVRGKEELQAALNAFSEANNTIISYEIDYKRKIAVPPKEAA